MANLLGRRTYRWNPELKKMVEIESRPPRPRNDDLRFEGNFISPIDGTEIRNKDDLNNHNQKHNVECTSDGHFQDWKEKQKERDGFYHSKAQKSERIEAIKHTLEKLGE